MSLMSENDASLDHPSHTRQPKRLFQSQVENDNESFQVFLRIKPSCRSHETRNCIDIVNNHKLVCKPPATSKCRKTERVEYVFSHIFGPESTQNQIFSECVVPSIEDLLNFRRSSLLFAYGTTNAGKTHTVQGNPTDPGIIPRTIYTIFNNVYFDHNVMLRPDMSENNVEYLNHEKRQDEILKKEKFFRICENILKTKSSHEDGAEFDDLQSILEDNFVDINCNMHSVTVWITFIELYNETVFDLLEYPPSRKAIRTDSYKNFYVKGLTHVWATNAKEAYDIYRFGKQNLNVATTRLNERSSRSHCVFTIRIIKNKDKEISSLSICDLAGTERQSKAGNDGIRLKESGTINRSLFYLNRCLDTLRENQFRTIKQAVPYRNCGLTKLFHSAFSDHSNDKIVMICNINIEADLYDETQQVLKMCAIASEIKTKSIIMKKRRSSFTTFVFGESMNGENSDNSDSGGDLDETIEDVHQLKEMLAAKVEENDKLQHQLQDLNKRYEDVWNYYKKAVEDQATMFEQQKTRHERLMRETKEYYKWKLEEQREKITKQFLESVSTKNTDEVSEKQTDSEIELLQDRIENFKVSCYEVDVRHTLEIANLRKALTEKDAVNENLRNLLHQAKIDYSELTKISQKTKDHLLNLKSDLQQKTNVMLMLEQDVAHKTNMIESLEERIEELETILSSSAVEHENEISEMEKKCLEKHEKLLKATKTIEDLKNKISELSLERDNLLQECSKQKNVNARLQSNKEEKKNTVNLDEEYNVFRECFEQKNIMERLQPDEEEKKKTNKLEEERPSKPYNTRNRAQISRAGKENTLSRCNSPFAAEKEKENLEDLPVVTKSRTGTPRTPLRRICVENSRANDNFLELPEEESDSPFDVKYKSIATPCQAVKSMLKKKKK